MKNEIKMLVAANYNNCGVVLYRFSSKKPITLDAIVTYLTNRYDFNIHKDSVEIVNTPIEISI